MERAMKITEERWRRGNRLMNTHGAAIPNAAIPIACSYGR